jgi:glycosyltransferase involved in cell wall biosynthesis
MASHSLKIGVIYGGISEQKAGMDHYLHQVLSAMKRLAPQHRYILIDHRRHAIPFRDQFEQRIIDLPAGPARVSRWNLRLVPKILSEFDLVFSPGLYGPLRIPEGVTSVMVVHDLTRFLFPDFFNFKVMHKVLDRFTYPAMLRRYDHLLTVSKTTRQDLMTLFKVPEKKITVVYHGAEEAFKPVSPQKAEAALWQSHNITKPFILSLGTLEPRKNIPTLLKAFAGITDRIPHHLVLVGQKGWKWEPIFKEMERPDLKERVHWVGYVSDEERVFFYNAAAFLAYPSWYEGFGMPLLEAMQCGCPVVTSRISSMPEVVGEAGLLIDPHQVGDLQGAMLRLVQEPGLGEKLRTAGFEQAKKFSWEKSAQITLEVFEKVTEMQSRRPTTPARRRG